MSTTLFFKSLRKNVRTSRVTIACVFMIVLLVGACAGGNTKQTLSQANETRQVSAKTGSENGETSGDQEIICRHKKYTGSRFRHKVCATKAQWARLDRKDAADTEEIIDGLNRNSGLNTGSSDSMGGASSGAPR